MGRAFLAVLTIAAAASIELAATAPQMRAYIDASSPGWRALEEPDFADVNGDPDTWTWASGQLHSTGKPIGVLRSTRVVTNFELLVEWKHLESGGNSGVFVWVPPSALEGLAPGKLPEGGIEVQMLDHGFREKYAQANPGKKTDWFTTNGDVFAVGTSKLTPFAPTSPNGSRSFPRRELSRGVGEWNFYYVRAIDGEIRLWVNGEEVSGGTNAAPRTGYLCLEAEGAPIDFRNIRIRELP